MGLPLYQALAFTLNARQNCERNWNAGWIARHDERVHQLVRDYLPHGSGIDAPVRVEWCGPDRMNILLSFHHMNSDGCYVGWQSYVVEVRGDLRFGFSVDVHIDPFGDQVDDDVDIEGMMDYLGELFDYALRREVE